MVAQQELEQKMSQLSSAFQDSKSSGDWSEPLRMIDALLAEQPEQVALQRAKLSLLMAAGKFDELHVLAEELAQQFADDPVALNDVAWNLITRVPPENQNHELALRIAKQASTLQGDEDASILDTVARVYYEQGNLEEAIAWQTKAVEFGPEGAKANRCATRSKCTARS